MKISNFLQAPFTHLLAHLLGGHPRVGASTFQAGGLGQSLRSPPPPPGTGAPSSINLFLLLELVLPSSISHLDPSCGSPRQVHTFTVDSVTLLVLPAQLRFLLVSLDDAVPSSLPMELSKLNVSLSSPPLANSSSTITLLSFGFSHPLNLLTSFLPSPLSCVSSVWAQLRLL